MLELPGSWSSLRSPSGSWQLRCPSPHVRWDCPTLAVECSRCISWRLVPRYRDLDKNDRDWDVPLPRPKSCPAVLSGRKHHLESTCRVLPECAALFSGQVDRTPTNPRQPSTFPPPCTVHSVYIYLPPITNTPSASAPSTSSQRQPTTNARAFL